LNPEAIVLTDSQVSAIKKSMRKKKVESLAFLFGKVKGNKLLTTDVLIPRKRDYAERTAYSVEIKPEYIAREFPKLIGQEKTLIATVHSHKLWRHKIHSQISPTRFSSSLNRNLLHG